MIELRNRTRCCLGSGSLLRLTAGTVGSRLGRTWAASREKWCKTMRDDANVKAQVRLPFDPSVLVAEMGQNGLGNRCSKRLNCLAIGWWFSGTDRHLVQSVPRAGLVWFRARRSLVMHVITTALSKPLDQPTALIALKTTTVSSPVTNRGGSPGEEPVLRAARILWMHTAYG